jgi:hypothetical protein
MTIFERLKREIVKWLDGYQKRKMPEIKLPPTTPTPPADKPAQAVCALCGLPMPNGEEMFKFHGYSGPCPKVDKPATGQAACTCDLSGTIPASMEDVRQVTISHPHSSECGLEEKEGIPIRPIVTAGGHILTVSDIYYGKIKRMGDDYMIPCNVEWLGYRWHPIGYSINEDHVARMQVRFEAGKPHIVPSVSRVFLFVEGRK